MTWWIYNLRKSTILVEPTSQKLMLAKEPYLAAFLYTRGVITLLTGDNTYETEQQLKALISDFSGEVEKFDGVELTLEMLPDLFMGVTLFATERLVVIKNASQNKTVWSDLSDWLEKAGDTDVVLIEPKADKRTKTYKWLQKNAKIVENKDLQPFEAEQWVVKKYDASREFARFFVDYVGVDQWRLETEFEKIRLSGKEPSESLVRELVEPTPQATSFELLDAAFQGRYELLDQRLAVVAKNEDPYMFFGLLASQVYALAFAKLGEGKNPDVIAKAGGIHPFVLRKLQPIAKRLSIKELEYLVDKLASLDASLKSRPVEPWVQISLFLKSLA